MSEKNTVQLANCDKDANAVLKLDLQRFADEPPAGDPPVDPTPKPTPEPTPAEPPKEPAKVVPETYADFTLPEGFAMDSKALEEFLPMAKELGMTQEAAQKAITMHANAVAGILQKQAEFREEKFKEVMAEVKADKDLGGAKFDENIGKINSVLNKFGGEGTSDTFLQAVAQLAAFDSIKAKALYATMDKIARAASVDTHLVKGGTVADPRPLANQIFDESLKDL